MKILWSIFAILGAVFFSVALLLGVINFMFYERALRTTGEVVSLRYSKGKSAPVVAYADRDGGRHEFHSHVYGTGYQVGDPVTIAYDPDAPDSAGIDGWSERWLLPTIFGINGGSFLLIGGIGLLRRARRKREIAHLMRHGERVDAEIVRVEQNLRLRVNRRHPWVIKLRWVRPTDRAVFEFRSRNLWTDPRPHLRGERMPVFIDPARPERHVVDTADLPTRPALGSP